MMDNDTLFALALALSKKGGGGGGLIPVPTAQDIGKVVIVEDAGNFGLVTLPEPMVFKGTLGTGGTISTLPTASSENEGFVYIVITDGTYAGISAKAGDTFVSDGSSWVIIPSADDSESLVISQTLTAGQTSITFNNASITADSWVKPYASVWGVICTNMVVSAGSVALTFEAQASDIIVGVEVR